MLPGNAQTLEYRAATVSGVADETGSADSLAGILRNRDIITFPHDWSGDPLSKTHVMRVLSRDNRVLWINSIGLRTPSASSADMKRIFNKLAAAATPIREVEPNIFAFSPLTIPAYGQPALRKLNQILLRLQVKRAIRKLGFKRIVNYVFLPSAGLLTGMLGESLLIYHCVDEYSAFTGMPSQALLDIEERLCRRRPTSSSALPKNWSNRSRRSIHEHTWFATASIMDIFARRSIRLRLCRTRSRNCHARSSGSSD